MGCSFRLDGGGTTTAIVSLAAMNAARSPSPRRLGNRSPGSSSTSDTPAASSRARMRCPCGRSAAERVTRTRDGVQRRGGGGGLGRGGGGGLGRGELGRGRERGAGV